MEKLENETDSSANYQTKKHKHIDKVEWHLTLIHTINEHSFWFRARSHLIYSLLFFIWFDCYHFRFRKKKKKKKSLMIFRFEVNIKMMKWFDVYVHICACVCVCVHAWCCCCRLKGFWTFVHRSARNLHNTVIIDIFGVRELSTE